MVCGDLNTGTMKRCFCGTPRRVYWGRIRKSATKKPVPDICKRCGNDANKFYKKTCPNTCYYKWK